MTLAPAIPFFDAFVRTLAAFEIFRFPCWWKSLVEKAKKVEENRCASPLFHSPSFLLIHKGKGGT